MWLSFQITSWKSIDCGHLGRTCATVSHCRALVAALTGGWNHPSSRPATLWLGTGDKYICPLDFGLHVAWHSTLVRDGWQEVVIMAMLPPRVCQWMNEWNIKISDLSWIKWILSSDSCCANAILVGIFCLFCTLCRSSQISSFHYCMFVYSMSPPIVEAINNSRVWKFWILKHYGSVSPEQCYM